MRHPLLEMRDTFGGSAEVTMTVPAAHDVPLKSESGLLYSAAALF
jgi:hypothetical protein